MSRQKSFFAETMGHHTEDWAEALEITTDWGLTMHLLVAAPHRSGASLAGMAVRRIGRVWPLNCFHAVNDLMFFFFFTVLLETVDQYSARGKQTGGRKKKKKKKSKIAVPVNRHVVVYINGAFFSGVTGTDRPWYRPILAIPGGLGGPGQSIGRPIATSPVIRDA